MAPMLLSLTGDLIAEKLYAPSLNRELHFRTYFIAWLATSHQKFYHLKGGRGKGQRADGPARGFRIVMLAPHLLV